MAFRVYGIVIFLKCQNSTLHCVCLCLMLGRDKKTSRPRQSNCALICFCSVTKKLFSGGCYHSQLISAAATLLGGQPSKEVLLQEEDTTQTNYEIVHCLVSYGSKTSRKASGEVSGQFGVERKHCAGLWWWSGPVTLYLRLSPAGEEIRGCNNI